MMLTSQYDMCLKSMFNLKRFGIKLGLSTIKSILDKLDNPQDNFRSIHVAGTNGKGSVASALSTILQKSGYRVGLYTSPHLVKFNERISVNGLSIDDKSVIELWKTISSVTLNNREATFFELSTAMALYEFKRRKVDFAIIETGMGGRLDATNIISPVLSIITNVSLEHKDYLGSTIKQISVEKAGIIKPKVPVVSGVYQKSAVSVVTETAKKMNSKLFLKGKDFRTRKTKNNTFSYLGKYNQWSNMRTNLIGDHQIDNAAVTLAACEILNQEQTYLPSTYIRSGLSSNKWAGRLEIALESPCIILDGAHNLVAARMLKKFLKENFEKKAITLVIGILDDKPYRNMLKDLASISSNVIVTKPKIERALPLEEMKKTARLFNNNVEEIDNVGAALLYAIDNSDPENIICVAGSLYVVGEAKIQLKKSYGLTE